MKKIAAMICITLMLVALLCAGCGNSKHSLSGSYYDPNDNLVLIFDSNGTMASPDNTITGKYDIDDTGRMKVEILASSLKFTGSGSTNADGTLDFVCGSVTYHMIPGDLPQNKAVDTTAPSSTSENSPFLAKEESLGKMIFSYDSTYLSLVKDNSRPQGNWYNLSDVGGTATAVIEYDPDYIDLFGYQKVDDLENQLVIRNDISGTYKRYDSKNYYVWVSSDYLTNTNNAFFEIMLVPKESAGDNNTYQIYLPYAENMIPSQNMYDACVTAVNKLTNEQTITITYQKALEAMKTVYDSANS
jgi:hypothetical protein